VTHHGLRERKKEQTRARITRVALELFARDGFAATTINAIAEAADVAPRTVSTYFPHKEEIVFEAYDPIIGRLEARIGSRRPDETVVDVIGDWLRAEAAQPASPDSAVVRAPGEDVDFARLRASAIARDPELWAAQRRRTLVVAQLVTDEAAKTLDGLAAKIFGAATLAVLQELNADAAHNGAGAADALDTVLDFLRAGLRALEK
jgi:AcrR family transcriptional regulator